MDIVPITGLDLQVSGQTLKRGGGPMGYRSQQVTVLSQEIKSSMPPMAPLVFVFGAPGSLITSNTIIARKNLCLGAINMVDYAPHDGNYMFTRVTHNTIVTAGAYIKVGIGQGPSVWGAQSVRQIERGAIVMANLIKSEGAGGGLGYGFAVGSDVADWTCTGNVSEEGVTYSGDISATLPAGFLNSTPGPFIHDRHGHNPGEEADSQSLVLQSEFVHGNIRGLISIKPGFSSVMSFEPGQLHIRAGEAVSLKEVELALSRDDGEVRILDKRNGRVLWEGGARGKIRDRDVLSRATLKLGKSGKLITVDPQNSDRVLHDFTPHIPSDTASSNSVHRAPTLVLSDKNPHLTIKSSTGDVFLSSSYFAPRFQELQVGQFVSRPVGVRVFVYVLTPQREFVVLRALDGGELQLPLRFPVDTSRFEVLWSTGRGAQNDVVDHKARFVFQGDGNLVRCPFFAHT
ncbi:hypothetical protein BOTBODRAFT_492232 [Botryobasidium botryosum FD-172 SS1]|uniref:Uncharacterized protein n=1 Tax=Botryobasidium botryosum (strain FD-172 SS1) TaxID=930990 RepID=A0A067M6Y8_BOTB1|nr:hypothetical protein BOTBODRAFT_492232 [Botryobasidium botryosum FD-172 SS1]